MLSAQSTDKKVNEITPKLFSKANTPEKMDRLEINEIRDYIREIGLAPTKAKNINNHHSERITKEKTELVKRQEQIIQGSKKLWNLLIIIIIIDHYQQIEFQHYLSTQKYLLQKFGFVIE